MSIFLDFLQKKADKDKKKKTKEEWLQAAAENADKCSWATHIGKFTNSSIKIEKNIFFLSVEQKPISGFATSAGTILKKDIYTSGNYSNVASLLLHVLENGKTVYENLIDDNPLLKKNFSELAVDYDEIRKKLLKIPMPQGHIPDMTDNWLKQVYFPVGGEDHYHLLSVLPPSSLMVELHKRIKKEKESKKTAHNCIPDRVEYKVVGSSPQNVSGLCAEAEIQGSLSLLPSFPPQLKLNVVRKPHRDFFQETLRNLYYDSSFSDNIFAVHDLLLVDRNNKNIRLTLRRREDELIDTVIWQAMALQQLPEGWTGAAENQLPKEQKIWLDQAYEEERQQGGWEDIIAGQIASWLLRAYRRKCQDKAVALDDEVWKNLRKSALSALRDDPADTAEERGMI